MQKIYHIHMRKTAGTAIYHMLVDFSNTKQHCPMRSEADLNVNFPIEQRIQYLRTFDLISGHFYTLGKFLIPEYTGFTFMRDPVARTLSTFNHIQNSPDDPFHPILKGMSLTEALNSNLADIELNNGQTRFLVGNAGYNHIDLNFENVLDVAKTFINTLFFVGIQELMDSSLRYLTQSLDLELPVLIHRVNTEITQSGVKMNQLSADELALIREHNQYDIQLYQYAHKLFERKVLKHSYSHPGRA